MKYDLHMHIICSDGKLKPEEVLRYAKEHGLKGVSITDHESFSEQWKTSEKAKKIGIDYITGIEIKTSLQPMLEKYGYSGLLPIAELLVYGLRKETTAEDDRQKKITGRKICANNAKNR